MVTGIFKKWKQIKWKTYPPLAKENILKKGHWIHHQSKFCFLHLKSSPTVVASSKSFPLPFHSQNQLQGQRAVFPPLQAVLLQVQICLFYSSPSPSYTVGTCHFSVFAVLFSSILTPLPWKRAWVYKQSVRYRVSGFGKGTWGMTGWWW